MNLEIKLLADVPEAFPTLARWYYDEWARPDEVGFESVSEYFSNKYLNSRVVPFILCGFVEGELATACQIKFREMKEFPEKEHWLGGVYTAEKFRGNGLARTLITKALEKSRSLGVQTLYLQTEQLDGGLYAEMGWRATDRVSKDEIEVIVMERYLD